MSVPSVIQPSLFVPDHIMEGLLSGEYFRKGSVVRNALGHIVAHLDEVPTSTEAAEQVAKRFMQINPRVALPIVLATAAVGAAGTAYVVIKKRKTAGEAAPAVDEVEVIELPPSVTDFETSLRAYVEAGQQGNLEVDVVDQLIADLDAVKDYRDGGNPVTFSLDQLEPLFALVIGHTPTLAGAYSVELDPFEGAPQDDVVIHLRRHLETQRGILQGAA